MIKLATFKTFVTDIGAAKIINAQLGGKKVNITTFVVGDGNGMEVNPSPNQTTLVNEVYSGPIASANIDEENNLIIVYESAIPADVGDFYIREVGLKDEDGDLIAVGNYPESYKPVATSGSTTELIVKMKIQVSNTDAINFKIDPTTAIASRDYVNKNIASLEQTVNEHLADIAINPVEFGAVGDGVTNDTQAFLSAITAMTSQKGTFRITRGVYLVDPVLVFSDMTNLRIEFGEGAKLLCRQTGATPKAVLTLNNINRALIIDANIDGDAKAWYGIDIMDSSRVSVVSSEIYDTLVNQPSRGDGSGIRIIRSPHCIVSGTYVHDVGGDGILVLGSDYCAIDNCISERCLRHNYAFAEPISRYCTLRNSVGKDSFLCGIDLETGRFCKITDNHFMNNGHYQNASTDESSLRSAIAMMASSYNNIVRGNIIDNPHSYGVWCVQPTITARTVDGFIQSVSDIIEGNTIRRASRIGVYLSAAQNQENEDTAYSVIGNIFEDCETGIRLGYTSYDLIIANNQMYRCANAITSSFVRNAIINANKIKDARNGITLNGVADVAVTSNIIFLNDVADNPTRYAIRVDNGETVINGLVVADNITNSDYSSNKRLLYLYSVEGYRNVDISGNTAKNGTPSQLYNVMLHGSAVHQNTRITYSTFELFLQKNHWASIGSDAGPTSTRPQNQVTGKSYFDTTLNKLIIWDGTKWVDAMGVTV